MKQIILALMLAVAGIGAAVAANPIREGNMISGHVLVKGSEESKHPIKYTIKKGCISFQVKQPSMVVSPSFFIPFFPFVWQHL